MDDYGSVPATLKPPDNKNMNENKLGADRRESKFRASSRGDDKFQNDLVLKDSEGNPISPPP